MDFKTVRKLSSPHNKCGGDVGNVFRAKDQVDMGYCILPFAFRRAKLLSNVRVPFR